MGRPSEYFLVPDPHFHQEETIGKFFNRPENYTELIIKNINYKVCKENDVLIFLGDMGDAKKLKETLNLITVKNLILTRGNHDKLSNSAYLDMGFSLVCDSLVIKNIILSHIPIKIFPEGVKFNLHGHHHWREDPNHWKQHELETVKYYDETKHVLYALELENYNILRLSEILFKLKNGKWKYGDKLSS